MTQTIPQKTSSLMEQQRTERITKSEDRNSTISTNIPFNDVQLQRYNFLKDKFDHQQPIDTVFGMKKGIV
jgi:hypothetical protein